MKKLLISLTIIALILLAIPLAGNKVIETALNNRVEVLTSYGLKVKKSNTNSSYLSTQKSYVFAVEDSMRFLTYLNQFSDTQLPPYVVALLDGAEVAIDLEYSNIALDDKVSIDIYPNALPSKLAKEIKSEDSAFYAYLNKLLQDKAIVYHLNYDVLNDSFDGYIKDIDETHTLKDGSKLLLKLKTANFKGTGMLIAPDTLSLDIKELKSSIQTNQEIMNVNLINFVSSSVFESKTTYATTAKFGSVEWSVKDNKGADVNLDMKNLSFDFSSNTQSVKADFFSKLSFDAMSITTDTTLIDSTKFNYDVAIRGVSKDAYEQLMELISQAKINQTPELQKDIEKAGYELLARGLVVDIADFSIKEVATAKTKNLGGMSLKSKLEFKQDRDLVKKIEKSPLALMEKMDLDLLFKISKEMYSKLTMATPILIMAQNFSKEKDGIIMFDIKLKDSKLSVNGQEIK